MSGSNTMIKADARRMFTCAFIAEDFRSGFAKNLFTVRAKKGSYVASKTLVCFLASVGFLLSFFVGAVLGGAIAGLPFTLGAAGAAGLVMCMLAKIFLMSVFVAIAVLVNAFAKQRSWLSILLFLFGGMLLFMMIPMMTPLNSGVMNVGLCLAGGLTFFDQCLYIGIQQFLDRFPDAQNV